MESSFKLATLQHTAPGGDLRLWNEATARSVQNFHKSFPMHAPTPLAQLPATAAARVLFFSTEGDTDKENYKRIVWDGLYPCV